MIRDDFADLVFRDENAKFNASIDEIVEMQEAGRPVLVGTVSVEKSEYPVDDAQAPRHQARDAQRQVPRAGGGDRRPGRAHRGGHDRHEHGRPRHRHQARRRRRGVGLGFAPPEGPQPGRGGRGHDGGGAGRRAAHHRRGPRQGGRVRRVAHHRHRAPRLAPHRQPAAWPRRPPGRPRLVALLPVARRRPDEALRVRLGDRADGTLGLEDDVAIESRLVSRSDRERPDHASRASTSTSASTSSSSTMSSTSSARRSTPSATRSSTTRT